MVWSMRAKVAAAVFAAICLCVTPCVAFADEVVLVEDESGQAAPVVVSEDASLVEQQQNEDIKKTLGEISQKLDKLEDVKTGVNDVKESVEGVSSQVDGLLVQNADPEPVPVERLAASNQTLTFTVYSHVSPTGTYATYAKQIIPKMGWDDDYVYFQDSSSSYTLVYGSLDYRTAGTFTGQGCNYVRWYYSGTGSGYVVQSGTADVSVSVGNYVVLSNLGNYPLLDDGITLLRQEVCFYALVAVILFSLHTVWSFLLRNRSF